MMIVMQPGAEQAAIEAVRARLAETGVHVVVMPGTLTTAIGAIGDPEGVAELVNRDPLERLDPEVVIDRLAAALRVVLVVRVLRPEVLREPLDVGAAEDGGFVLLEADAARL